MSSFPASPEDASECTPVLNQSLTAEHLSKTRGIKNPNKTTNQGPRSPGGTSRLSSAGEAPPSGSRLPAALLMGLFIWVTVGSFFFSYEGRKPLFIVRALSLLVLERKDAPTRHRDSRCQFAFRTSQKNTSFRAAPSWI